MHDDGVYVCVCVWLQEWLETTVLYNHPQVCLCEYVCVCVHMSQDSLIVTLNQCKPWWQQLQYGQFYPILTDIHNV